jgi:putative membrane protein
LRIAGAAALTRYALPMRRLLLHWLVVACSLALAAYLVPGVRIGSLGALLAGALVLGLVNALVRPLLTLLTLPITLLTLGLFYLVVNGLSFGLAAWLVPGFSSSGLWPSILGALVVSLCSWVVGGALHRERRARPKRKSSRD